MPTLNPLATLDFSQLWEIRFPFPVFCMPLDLRMTRRVIWTLAPCIGGALSLYLRFILFSLLHSDMQGR